MEVENSHIVVAGTGAVGRIALDILAEKKITILGFITTKESERLSELNDISVFAMLTDEDTRKVLKDEKIEYFVAEGDIEERKSSQTFLADMTKRPPANLVHPKATISPYAKIGFGNLVNASSVVDANASIGDGNVLHAGVSIGTNANIGSYVTIGAGSTIGANAKIEEDVFIGTGAVVSPGITIGAGCRIMAGAVVMQSLSEGETVFGNPAKPI